MGSTYLDEAGRRQVTRQCRVIELSSAIGSHLCSINKINVSRWLEGPEICCYLKVILQET